MILDNRYEVRDLLYGDTSISLHQGYDRLLNRPVAIEQLQPQLARDPQVVARFLDTARTLATIELPHVAALYDQGEADGHPFLIFEEALPNSIATAAPLPSVAVPPLVRQVTETLRVAAGRGGMLPLLTPQAVRYASDGSVQIMQTGLGVQAPVSSVMPALTLLVLVALTGSPDGHGKTALAPALVRVVERARANHYATPEVLLQELEAAAQQATAQQVVVPPLQAAGAQSVQVPPPLTGAVSSQAVEAGVGQAPRRTWAGRGVLVGALVLLLVGSVVALMRRPTARIATSPTSTVAAGQPSAIPSPSQASPTRMAGQPYIVATANGRPLNIRQGPTISSTVIGTAPAGAMVQVFDTPVQADGYTWVHIQSGTADGWCIREALRK